MNPIPLITAAELQPLWRILSAEDRATIERWCEINRRWIEAGTSTAPVLTSDVRGLLFAAVALARECLRQEDARSTRVTLPDTEEGGL